MEKNWFVIEYDPNASPLEQKIYEIYEEVGIPIFLTDTLGSQTRYDLGGNPYTHYEIFDPGYTFTNYSPSYTFSLETDEADLEAMVDLLADYVLRPYFKNTYADEVVGKYGPHGLVILDSINRGSAADTMLVDLGVIGLSTRNTMRVEGLLFGVQELTEANKQAFGWNFAIFELDRYFTNAYPDEYAHFRDILGTIPREWTEDEGAPDPFKIGGTYNIEDYNLDLNEPRKYGILVYGQNNGTSIWFPNQQTDFHLYMKMIKTMSDEEIRVEHGEFPYVIMRYEALVALLQKAGLTQFFYSGE